ncbi:MAG TPA: hypothetical protein VFM53_08185 [Anaeromyxobacteraceae bacterium]|nr:hypothetical protein [Anaeromyxobacteraceae bacterium]
MDAADAAASTVAGPQPRALHAQSRLLLPFLFERRAADQAALALETASGGLARGIWVREPPRKLYRYRLEMTGQLDRFLFSHGEKGAVEGAYLHASGERIRRWLGALDVDLGHRTARVGLAPSPGVELFLTAHGAGVLSFTFDLGAGSDLASVLELNRKLSILTRPGERAPWLSTAPPPGEAPPPPGEGHPGSTVPLGERLGRPGARFSLAELIAALAEPLRGMGVAPIQESLCAYTVVSLPAGVDLEASKAWTGPFLSALAQVQGSVAPAGDADDLGIPDLRLSRGHWSAASLQGAAHLLCEHGGPAAEPATQAAPAASEERLAEVRDRWFVPYLTALLQRCAIKKAAEEATDMVVREEVKGEAVSRLRSDVLAFALAGALPEVSVRYALHRYYRMCQEAVDLDRNLGQVREALGDLEAQLSAKRQVEIGEAQRDIARQSVESQESAHRIHMSLVWIEVFIVVAYAAELVKFFVLELPHIEVPWMRWTAGLGSVAAGAVALLVLRPWDHRHGKKGGHAKVGEERPGAPATGGGHGAGAHASHAGEGAAVGVHQGPGKVL